MKTANDARANKVAFLSHCILNVNSKVYELARYAGMAMEVLEVLNRHDIAVIQLPCPELLYLGPRRWWQVKDMYDMPAYRRFCYQLGEQVSEQVRMYRQVGVEVICILGVDGSPNCGVNLTPQSGDWGGRPQEMPMEQVILPGRGVFMEELDRRLREDRLESVPIFGLALENPKRSMSEMLEELEAFLIKCLESYGGTRISRMEP